MDIRVHLLYDMQDIIPNVVSIENQDDYFIVIKYKKNDKIYDKLYMFNQVVKIDCRL